MAMRAMMRASGACARRAMHVRVRLLFFSPFCCRFRHYFADADAIDAAIDLLPIRRHARHAQSAERRF